MSRLNLLQITVYFQIYKIQKCRKFHRSSGLYTILVYRRRYACMCSSGLEVLSCPFSTKFLRSTDLRFTTSPAIAFIQCCAIVLSFLSSVRWGRHTLCQAWFVALDCAAWQCVWLLSVGIIQTLFIFRCLLLIIPLPAIPKLLRIAQHCRQYL